MKLFLALLVASTISVQGHLFHNSKALSTSRDNTRRVFTKPQQIKKKSKIQKKLVKGSNVSRKMNMAPKPSLHGHQRSSSYLMTKVQKPKGNPNQKMTQQRPYPQQRTIQQPQQQRTIQYPVNQANKFNAFLAECIASHNYVRRKNRLPELVLDPALTQSAKQSANYIASRPNYALDHNYPELASSGFGENLTRGYPTCSSAIVIILEEYFD